MNYGCSQCLAVAIESHQSSLLEDLLQRPGVAYRDSFWARTFHLSEFNKNIYLNNNSYNGDFSLIGKANCGHIHYDLELMEPVIGTALRGRFLVSLPIFSRWHSSRDFPAEQLLLNSGKFDYSTPQLYHESFGELLGVEVVSRPELHFYFKNDKAESSVPARDRSLESFIVGPGKMTVSGCLHEAKNVLQVHHMYDTTSLSVTLWNRYGIPEIQFDSGVDINRYFEVLWTNRRMHFLGFFSFASRFLERSDWARNISIVPVESFFRTFFANGLSYFLGPEHSELFEGPSIVSATMTLRLNRNEVDGSSFFQLLFSAYVVNYNTPHNLEACRGIAMQLLALGYGRRELHPEGVALFDERLARTRAAIPRQREQISRSSHAAVCAGELQALVDRFDGGPLTLRQIARVAVRRAVGGAYFARRIATLSGRLPRALLDYVAEPSEYLRPAPP